MAYKYKVVKSASPAYSGNITDPQNLAESGPYLLDIDVGPDSGCVEIAADKSYSSLVYWGKGAMHGTTLFTQHITGCIPVMIYCASPHFLAMVHFGACDSGRTETYKEMLLHIPKDTRSKVYAAAVMSDRDSEWFARSQFENNVLPALTKRGVPEDNILFYHDTTEDCLVFAITPSGDIGTPKSLKKVK